jgi:radical SAM superfamily enzyme YgiQ (UPF0313 family)
MGIDVQKCLLIQSKFSSHSFYNFSDVARFVGARYPAAPLGLMTVAALLPQRWEFRLVDENVRALRDADIEWADIVLVSGMLPQQKGILTAVRRAHGAGKPVAVGGPDPSSQPHIYGQADYVVMGEGEVTIPSFVEDLNKGVASGIYRSDRRADMAQSVVPRFDLIRFADYMRVGIQFSRGCPFNCEFCDIIELFGRRPRTKPPERMVAELQALYDLGYRGHVDFVDDNFIGNKAKGIEALQAIGDWSKRHGYPFYFSTEASINLVQEEQLLQLMRENDFRYVFVGIESPDEDVLTEAHKAQNKRVSAVDAVRTLASYGMIVNGGFVLGFDSETERTADRMIDLIQEAGIGTALVSTLTALPNTQLSHRLQREGRLFAGGRMLQSDAQLEIDNTTSGLNFATSRPRTDILRDQAQVLRTVYDPANYYARVLRTALDLAPDYRYRPGFVAALKLVWAWLKVSVKVGLNRRTGPLYWKTLFTVLAANPRAAQAAISMAALYVHFGQQSEFVIDMLERKIADIERSGEKEYNERMIAGIVPVPRSVDRPLPRSQLA